MRERSKLKIPDLVSIGVYTALYVALVAIAAMFSVFILPGYSFIFIPIVAALITGPVFMLLAVKVPKFGAVTVMGSMMGILFLLTGRFPLAIIPSILFGLLADLIVSFFPRRKVTLLVAYLFFSYNVIGPIIPLLFFPSYYAQDLADRGRDLVYIQGAFANITANTGWFILAGVLVAGLIGGMFGLYLMKKHFEKSGLV